jgi:hypothetical protein
MVEKQGVVDVTVARRDNVGWGNKEYYLYNVYNRTGIEK